MKHIRTGDMIEDKVRSKLSPTNYLDIKSNTQTHFSLCVSGVHLATHLLRGPWHQSKFERLGQLFVWGLESIPLISSDVMKA